MKITSQYSVNIAKMDDGYYECASLRDIVADASGCAFYARHVHGPEGKNRTVIVIDDDTIALLECAKAVIKRAEDKVSP